MKQITAVIKPFKLDEVREALCELGVHHLTLLEAKGYSGRGGREECRGAEYVLNFLPKVQISLVVSDEVSERAVEVILQAARTGRVGDGIVTIMPVEQCWKIRTGEVTVNPDE